VIAAGSVVDAIPCPDALCQKIDSKKHLLENDAFHFFRSIERSFHNLSGLHECHGCHLLADQQEIMWSDQINSTHYKHAYFPS
jgi:hypothetical protein